MKRTKDIIILSLLVAGSIYLVSIIPAGTVVVPADPVEKPDTSRILEMPEREMTEYGFPSGDYFRETKTVRYGQTLADLLLPYGVSQQFIYGISLLPDSIINTRKIQQGKTYTVFCNPDSTPAFFVYEKDPVNYTVIGLGADTVAVYNGSRPVVKKIHHVSGTVHTSLWETMLETGANPMLAVELSEIYAWTIDFFGLQPGDRFKIMYEEFYVDSLSVGIGQILGAWFFHSNHEFWAIPFIQENVRSFYDEKGNSLRKAFLKAPLRYSRISSRFSNSRLHPILKIRRPHHGVDYAAPYGTPVEAVGDGQVVKVGYDRGGGNFVKIRHNSVYTTEYMHLSRFGQGIHQGSYVTQAEIIGYVGATGLATGPHLDFRFFKNGRAVDPLKVEAPPVEPVSEANQPVFEVVKRITMQSLKTIQ